MKKILHIISSPRGNASVSIQLGNAIIAKLQEQHPDSEVETLNLLEEPMPHLDAPHLQAFYTPKEQLTEADRDAIVHSDKAIAQLKAADFIVLGAPLYNFGIHSALKAWIDHIVRAGVTFNYSEQGPQGLVHGKKVYIAFSAGGVYSDGPYKPYDFVAPYLQAVLGFLGMTDVTIYRAEGVNMPGLKEHALDKAVESIEVA